MARPEGRSFRGSHVVDHDSMDGVGSQGRLPGLITGWAKSAFSRPGRRVWVRRANGQEQVSVSLYRHSKRQAGSVARLWRGKLFTKGECRERAMAGHDDEFGGAGHVPRGLFAAKIPGLGLVAAPLS